jgi:rubrerythrin
MEIQTLLKPLEELEREMQALYEWLAETFAADREAARVFFRLAMDEKRHATMVEHLRRLARQNPQLFPAIDASLGEVARCLVECRALRGNGSPPSLRVAIQAAVDLENAAAESHYRQAIGAAVPEITQLLQALGEADRLHGAALTRLAAARGL